MLALNGRQLSDRLKLVRPRLPVLFMSGYTDDEMVRRGLIEPHHPFLSKPFTPEILAAKVRQMMTEPPASEPDREPSGHLVRAVGVTKISP